MSFDELYNLFCIKVKSSKSEGSGVLINSSSPDSSYVITAKHCLTGKKENDQELQKGSIKVQRLHPDGGFQEFIVRDYFLHSVREVDLAIIIIEKVNLPEQISATMPNYNSEVHVKGFPAESIKTDNPMSELKGHITNVKTYRLNRVEFSIPPQQTFDKEAKVYIEGFSGSGLFEENQNGTLFLMGIFTQVKHDDVAYGDLEAESILKVNEILQENDYPLIKIVEYQVNNYPHLVMNLKQPSNLLTDYQNILEQSTEDKLQKLIIEKRSGNRKQALTKLYEILEDVDHMSTHTAAKYYMKASLWG
ncbi:hypothetical protein PTI45_03326 [Paenibacillus nuruki]|uniref:Peptidase S1 domain-containing protein n=1 Tax=Paenibacillus nuruki TaxID=1886670 RepID=A0A1E3L0R9_9BACL|nr:trypsin-like peptidase domain-containing protein [Paenibacillus nuruki]ODP27201.1 hypothetical protein PTI45_03326 [Paenibacillus nuruki]